MYLHMSINLSLCTHTSHYSSTEGMICQMNLFQSIMHRYYSRYLYQTNTIVLTNISTVNVRDLCATDDAHCVSWKINNIAKYAELSNNGVPEMEIDLSDGREDNEHNGVGFVEISKVFA